MARLRIQRGALTGALLAGLLAVPAIAAAEITIRPPAGWVADDDGDAEARARAWIASRDDARIVRVYTPAAADAFAEVLALIELSGAFRTGATDADEITRALTGIPGFDATAATWSRDDLASGAPRLRASWEHDRLQYHADLVASGTTRTLLIGATLTSEAALYGRTFAETSASLQGAESPTTPFDRAAWRVRTLLVAVLSLAAALGLALWRRPFGASARDIGRVVAIVCVLAAGISAWITATSMTAQADALRAANLSADTLAAEIATYGLVAAVIAWGVGMWLGRGEGPIASAPQRGAFADRSSASLVSIPIIPKVPPRTEAVGARRHPDGPSRLEDATSPPGSEIGPGDRTPRA